MKYRRFDPSAFEFPKPKVPVLPTLSRHSLLLKKSTYARALLTLPNISFYSRGRYALAQAYRLCGVGANTVLLAPAYHCRTMLDPAIRLGGEIALYPMHSNLAPDMEGLAACLVGCSKPAKALLVAHYFGFQQDLAELLKFCAAHAIALIEDCSHCLPAQPGEDGPGRLGRYGISSPYKFFPCVDGGALWANQNAPTPLDRTLRFDAIRELKGVALSLQLARISTPAPDRSALSRTIDSIPVTQTPDVHDLLETSLTTSDQYDVGSESSECLMASRWIMRHADIAHLITRRRENYTFWVNAVSALPHCQALFPVPPDNCVPYMFPLRIVGRQEHFFALKQLGLPIWRWDDMAVSSCRVASDYRLQLLHLPCHQELTAAQMEWMTSAVAAVLTSISADRD